MILYGKPVADALREQYAERIEAMAWKRTQKVKDCPDTPEGVYDKDCPELEKLGIRYLTEEEMEGES